eukprot:TRINITY_DN8180_c0_g1_i3.p1 TRINITY_DN8180_c0_g1~~TRINITY_DN8180_c0_g1_i3.p1  ORF type:complete len:827 (-),score=123.12 TRINITY_DN8180_c0_g1_i3:357-2837(-)
MSSSTPAEVVARNAEVASPDLNAPPMDPSKSRSSSFSSQHYLGASLSADAFTPLMASQQTMQHHSTDIKVLQHLDFLVARFKMEELFSAKGGPFLTLLRVDRGEPIGTVRVFRGGPIEKLVLISLTMPGAEMESYLLFAFLSAESPLPHYAFNVAKAGLNIAFSIDLIPRVEGSTNPKYIPTLYEKIQDARSSLLGHGGVRAATLSPEMASTMSPYLAAGRTTNKIFRNISPFFDVYLNHWVALIERGVEQILPDTELTTEVRRQLRSRDLLVRKTLFNPAVDPTWVEIAKLCGRKICISILELLIYQEFVPPSAQVAPVSILGNSEIAHKAMDFVSNITNRFGMEIIHLSRNPGSTLELYSAPQQSVHGEEDKSTHTVRKVRGFVKLFRGGLLEKLVHIQVANEEKHSDHHLILGFTHATSGVPHLYIELQKVKDLYNYKVDLLARVDLGSSANYIAYYYDALTRLFDVPQDASSDFQADSSSSAPLRQPRHVLAQKGVSMTQISFLSPWALVAAEQDIHNLQRLSIAASKLTEYWMDMVSRERSHPTGLVLESEVELARRDAKLRQYISNDEINPIWSTVRAECGDRTTDAVKDFLKLQSEDHGKHVAVVFTETRPDFMLHIINKLLDESYKVKILIPNQDHPSVSRLQTNVLKSEVNFQSVSSISNELSDCWAVILCTASSANRAQLPDSLPHTVSNILEAIKSVSIHHLVFVSRHGATRVDSWGRSQDLEMLHTCEDVVLKSRIPFTILRIGGIVLARRFGGLLIDIKVHRCWHGVFAIYSPFSKHLWKRKRDFDRIIEFDSCRETLQNKIRKIPFYSPKNI